MTIRSVLVALPLLFFGWFFTLVAVALLTDEAPAYVVLFPGEDLVRDMHDDVSIISDSQFSVTLTSDRRGLARTLYGNGASIVLPAGLPGCLPLPRP